MTGPTWSFPFDERKARAALAYIQSKEPGIEPVKLALLLTLAEVTMYRTYGRPLVGGRLIATEAGVMLKEACEGFVRMGSPWLPHAAFGSWRRGTWA